jgi:hypothetical protein
MSQLTPPFDEASPRTQWVIGGRIDSWYALGGGLAVPQEVDVYSLVDDEWSYAVDVSVVFDPATMRYEITYIGLRADTESDRLIPLTALSLRALLINKLEEKIFTGEFPILVLSDKLFSDQAFGFDGLENGASVVRGNGPTPEALEFAASIYSLFFAMRGKPTQKIAELLKLPPSTASHWVRLARQRGYLSKDSSRSLDRAELISDAPIKKI